MMGGNQTNGGDHSLVYTDVDAMLYTWNLYNKKNLEIRKNSSWIKYSMFEV